MISNLYTWIFPAAVFLAAGLSNLSASVKKKRNKKRANSNRIVWFSINFSIAFCFLAASSFFVNWSEFVWLPSYLYFFLTIIIIFYLIFIYKFIFGLPVVFFFTFIVLFFNIYLQEWRILPDNGVVGWYRLMSYDENGIRAEISSFDSSSVFINKESSDLILEFELLELDRSLFFIDSNRYYRIADSLIEPGFSERIVDFLIKNTFFVSESIYNLEITQFSILHQYNIVLDIDRKKIFTDN